MRELAGRLEALAPDAGAAVRAVAYFDQLLESGAGLEAIVRGAALLAGAPAYLRVPARGVGLRVGVDGVATRTVAEPDANGPDQLEFGPGATIWLECPSSSEPVTAVVLQRAALAARVVLERSAQRSVPAVEHSSPLDVLLAPEATEAARATAAAELNLRGAQRVFAEIGGQLTVIGSDRSELRVQPGQRAGVGPAVSPLKLASTVAGARTAALFTADAARGESGPSLVFAEDLGALILLAELDVVDLPLSDITAVDRAMSTADWAADTLEALSHAESVRDAASALFVHHSTLQSRRARLEQSLGWSLSRAVGRQRLACTLALRRLIKSRRAERERRS